MGAGQSREHIRESEYTSNVANILNKFKLLKNTYQELQSKDDAHLLIETQTNKEILSQFRLAPNATTNGDASYAL